MVKIRYDKGWDECMSLDDIHTLAYKASATMGTKRNEADEDKKTEGHGGQNNNDGEGDGKQTHTCIPEIKFQIICILYLTRSVFYVLPFMHA